MEITARQETYYVYQCTKCFNRTSYCLRCNRTMDNLLNSLFFKCFFCKVLTRIVHRESISPEQSNINRLLYNNICENNVDNEIKGLFHPSVQAENNTPIKNLIAGCFDQTNMTNQSMNPYFNHNRTNNQPLPQNLLNNFNQAVVNPSSNGDVIMNNNNKVLNKNICNSINRTDGNSNNFHDLLQTPKTNYKFERNLLFSPEGNNFQTPLQSKTIKIEQSINLRNLGLGYSTPRNVSKIITGSGSINRTAGSMNLNEEGALSIEDFDNKLNIQKNQQMMNNNLNQSFNLLANRNRMGGMLARNKFNVNNLSVNKLNNSKGSIIEINSSEFAGYNKTEPARKSVSKSPLSLRKRSKHNFGLTESKANTSFILKDDNKMEGRNNSEPQNLTTGENTLFLSNFKPTSFMNYTDENLQHQQKFGANSYLSDIKLVNNYNSNMDNSKFSFSTNNGYENFLKMTNNSNN